MKKTFFSVTPNIDWDYWKEKVLSELPDYATLGDSDIIKKHLEAAIKELKQV